MEVLVKKSPKKQSQKIVTNSGIEWLGPKEAAKMLSQKSGTGIHQRPLSVANVNLLSDQMEKGKWSLQYEPIIVSEFGFVMDGQHRLQAIIKSNTTQQFLVVRNAEESVMPKIGIGSKRKSSDVLAMNGYLNSKCLSAVLTIIWKYYTKGGLLGRTGAKQERPREYEYLELADEYKGAIQATSYAVGHKCPFLPQSEVGALWYITGEVDKDCRNVFFAKLISGINLVADDPVHLLREKLIKIQLQKKQRGLYTAYKRADRMALVIKAWNAMRSGRTIKTLYFRSGEKYPEAI